MTLERARERGGICFIQYLEPMWLPTVSRDSQISQILWNKNIWSGAAPLINWFKWHFNKQSCKLCLSPANGHPCENGAVFACTLHIAQGDPVFHSVLMEDPFAIVSSPVAKFDICQILFMAAIAYVQCAHFYQKLCRVGSSRSLVWQIKRWIWDGDRAVT